MKKKIAIFLLLISSGLMANATSIKTYASRAVVVADGSARVILHLELVDAVAGNMVIPIGFDKPDDFQTGNNAPGVSLTPHLAKERPNVEVNLPASLTGNVTLDFSFTVPALLGKPKEAAGEQIKIATDTGVVRHSFVNTESAPIGHYTLDILLPDAKVVQKIAEQLPKPKRSELLPRVRLDRFDGQLQGATLQMSSLKQGDRASMVLYVVDAKRSLGWLLVGAAISLAYLFGFRDLVKPNQG